MSYAERENDRKNIQPLYKIKRAVLETTQIQYSDIVAKKTDKNVISWWTDIANLEHGAIMRMERKKS